MEFRVLGPVVAVANDAEVPLGGPKQRTVLALVIAHGGYPVSVDALISGVYGDEASDGARRTIHTYVSNLRRVAGDAVVRAADGYRLDPEIATVDAVTFEELSAKAAGLVESAPADAAVMLREALALWRGHPYADVDARSVLDGEIVRLQELRLAAIEARIAADLALGTHRELVGELAALVEDHPLREGFRAQQMLALYRSGRQSEALRAYGRAREVLGETLGIEPSRELQELEQQVLDQDPALDLRPAVTIEQRAILAAELRSEARSASSQDLDARLARRNEILANSAENAGGAMLDVRGTAAFAAFPTVEAAIDAARLVVDPDTQVALDFGDIEMQGTEAAGPPVTMALRLVAVANGGQILVSDHAHGRLAGEGSHGWAVSALGQHAIRGVDRPVQVYQLMGPGLITEHPPLRLDRLPPPLWGVESRSVPGFELRRQLTADVAGVIHTAYQPSTGREVAVRAFRPELVADPRFVRRFEAVSQRVVSTDHPNLTALLDYWREPSRAFWVQRSAPTRDAGSLIGAGPVEPDVVVSILEGIGGALEVSHGLGLAHGLIHPRHIGVDGSGHVTLSQLGVAAMLDGLAAWPADAYTAPEAIGRKPSIASDVYALGVVAAELLSGTVVPADGTIPLVGSPVDEVVARATHHDPAHRYESAAALVQDVRRRIGRATSPAVDRATRSAVRNPYKGLLAFEEADAHDFYGRREIVESLAKVVGQAPFTLVAGPSGIGKSSLVRAGLVPAMRSAAGGGWLVTDLYPGARPFDALEGALNRVAFEPVAHRIDALRSGAVPLASVVGDIVAGERVLIVIDQFEELFTLTSDEDARRSFLSMLTELATDPESNVRVVATIRADFLDRPLQHAEFAKAMARSTVTVGAASLAELAEIIELPARAVGVEIDAGLVELLAREAGSESGALPLLQYTLTELFDERGADRITVDDYREAGGVVGSIGRRAEAAFTGLSLEDQGAAREILLRLVTVDDAGSMARRRVRRSDLAGGEAVDRVLDAFGRHRLLVFDRDPTTHGPTVEVAHEALLARWPRLANWIGEAREDLVFAHRLESAVAEWAQASRDASYLLSGSRLERAVEWRERSEVPITPATEEFIELSLDRRDAEAASRQRQRRRVTGVLAIAAAVAMVMAVAAWIQRGSAQDAARLADEEADRAQAAAQEAVDQRAAAQTAAALATEEAARADEAADEALAQAMRAQARELTLEADRAIASDPELAIHLGLVALDSFFETFTPPRTAVTVLRRAMAADRVAGRFVGGEFVAVSVDGTQFATQGEAGGVAVWDVDSRELIEVIEDVDGQAVDGAAYTAVPRELVVSLEAGGPLLVRDPSEATWRELPGSEGSLYLRFSPDGRRYAVVVASGQSFLVEVWDRESESKVLAVEAANVPFDLSNDRLAYIAVEPEADRSVVEVIDIDTGAPSWSSARDPVEYLWSTFSPSGNRLALSNPGGIVTLVDAETGSVLWQQTGIDRSWRPVWVDAAEHLLLGGEAQFTVVNAATGEVAFEIAAHDGGSFAYDWVPGTSRLISAGIADEQTLLIDVVAEVPELGFLQAPFVVEDLGVADGVLVMTGEGQHAAWDLESEEMIGEAAPGRLYGHLDNAAAIVVEVDGGDHVLVERRSRDEIYRAPSGARIVGISAAAELVVLDPPEGPVEVVRTGDRTTVALLDAGGEVLAAFTPDDEHIVTRDNSEVAESAINIWRTSDGAWLNGFGGEGDITPGGWDIDVADSDDTTMLAVGGYDGTLQVFDLQQLVVGASPIETRLFNQQAHTEFVREVEFDDSRNSFVMLSRAFDSVPRMWMIELNEALGEFATPVTSDATFHPFEFEVLSTDGDRILRSSIDLQVLIKVASDRLSRELTEEECELYIRESCAAVRARLED